MEQFITLLSGHSLYADVYEEKKNYLHSLLRKDGLVPVDNLHSCKAPNGVFDYSFLVKKAGEITRETMSLFSQAGLKTTINELTGNHIIVGFNY